MKAFFIFLIFLTLFTGCSKKNAFYEFKMDKERELSVSNLQNSKIVSKDGEISGIFSAIYLNKVYPETLNEEECFFVFFFTKDAKELQDNHNITESDLKVTLNSKSPLAIEKLSQENRFSHLVETKNSWNRYYVVTFQKVQTLNLELKDANISLSTLKFKRDF